MGMLQGAMAWLHGMACTHAPKGSVHSEPLPNEGRCLAFHYLASGACLPSPLPAQVPKEAFELNFVISDGEQSYDNNGGQDYMYPVTGACVQYTHEQQERMIDGGGAQLLGLASETCACACQRANAPCIITLHILPPQAASLRRSGSPWLRRRHASARRSAWWVGRLLIGWLVG